VCECVGTDEMTDCLSAGTALTFHELMLTVCWDDFEKPWCSSSNSSMYSVSQLWSVMVSRG